MLQAGLLTSRIKAHDRLPSFPVTSMVPRSPLTVTSSYRICTCFPSHSACKKLFCFLQQNTCICNHNTILLICKQNSSFFRALHLPSNLLSPITFSRFQESRFPNHCFPVLVSLHVSKRVLVSKTLQQFFFHSLKENALRSFECHVLK